MIEGLKDPDHRVNEEIFVEFGRYEIDHDGFGGFQPIRSAFNGRYKLTVNLLTTDELYDLELAYKERSLEALSKLLFAETGLKDLQRAVRRVLR